MFVDTAGWWKNRELKTQMGQHLQAREARRFISFGVMPTIYSDDEMDEESESESSITLGVRTSSGQMKFDST